MVYCIFVQQHWRKRLSASQALSGCEESASAFGNCVSNTIATGWSEDLHLRRPGTLQPWESLWIILSDHLRLAIQTWKKCNIYLVDTVVGPDRELWGRTREGATRWTFWSPAVFPKLSLAIFHFQSVFAQPCPLRKLLWPGSASFSSLGLDGESQSTGRGDRDVKMSRSQWDFMGTAGKHPRYNMI